MLDNRAAAVESAHASTVRRMYDVRDILNEAEMWSKPLRPLHARSRRRGLFGGGGGGYFQGGGLFGGGSYYDDEHPLRAYAVAQMIRWTIAPDAWDDPALGWNTFGWGGWVVVDAPRRAHREVERLLELLRRGDSELFLTRGAAR
jgi:hypothetical protein